MLPRARSWLGATFAAAVLTNYISAEHVAHLLREQAYAYGLFKPQLESLTGAEIKNVIALALAAGRLEQALAYASAAAALEPHVLEHRLLVGRSLRALQRDAAAQEVFEGLLGSDLDALARLELFEMWLQRDAPERAMSWLRQAQGTPHGQSVPASAAPSLAALDAGDLEDLARRIDAAAEAGAHHQVVLKARRLLVDYPERHAVRLQLAESYRSLNRADAAQAQYRHLLGTPLESAARMGLFDTYVALGRPDAAKAALRGDEPDGLLHAAAFASRSAPGALETLAELPPPRLPRLPAPGTAGLSSPEQMPEELRDLMQAYWDGDYARVAEQGPNVLQRHPDADLRLAVANSLAWTGRPRDAIELYRALLETELRTEALIGIVSSYRWLGEPSAAVPYMEQAVRERPDRVAVQEAQRLLAQDMRARTRVAGRLAGDSTDARQQTGSVHHRFWAQSGRTLVELGLAARNNERDPVREQRHTLSVNLQRPSTWGAPEVQLDYRSGPRARLLPDLRLQLGAAPITLSLGTLDWGVTDPLADRDGMYAHRAGLQAELPVAVGSVEITFSQYRISDRNRISEGELAFTPQWQPLGEALSVFASLYGRDARRDDPRYWTPADGYYTLGPGVRISHGGDAWHFYAVARAGFALSSASSTSVGGGGGARYRLSKDVSVGADTYVNRSTRDEVRYRGRSGTIFVELLW
jgi:tetratricopeptide (TPR) repeat protein